MVTFFHFQDCYKVIFVFALSSIGFFILYITILSKEWEHEKSINKRTPSEFFYVSFLCGALVSLLAVFLIDFNNMQGEKEKSVKTKCQLVAKALDVNEKDIVFYDFEDSGGKVQENQKGFIIKKLDKQYVVIFDSDIKTTKIIHIRENHKFT
ncbi:hypothetical protein SIM22_04305 [Bacillus cereus group sp. BfR-BA-01363]|uniref:hypothetical protein n=1 Tax=Bacillus cereus group sp. BfR-BA-01363 TaxID=3094882 RepID=UPI0029C4A235|nr:hypothetical protein [Bacillus cereus group sp. BfR-BA-01363]MDX5853351.1 hypothetical protein [Bacillus cereus group sp. BfR-BA-01363]